MLLVLALLGVVTALVAPSLGFLAPSRRDGLTAATDEVMSVLAEARLTALEGGTSVDVVIDPSTARVWTYTADRGERRLIASGTLRLTAGALIDAEEPRVRITFDAAGTASGGPVIVRGIAGARQVAVDPWSGVASAAAR